MFVSTTLYSIKPTDIDKRHGRFAPPYPTSLRKLPKLHAFLSFFFFKYSAYMSITFKHNHPRSETQIFFIIILDRSVPQIGHDSISLFVFFFFYFFSLLSLFPICILRSEIIVLICDANRCRIVEMLLE